MDALLALVPEAQRSGVRRTATKLSADARRWARPARDRLGEQLCHRLGVTITLIAPELPPERLRLLVRFSVWCYVLDDLFDDPTSEPADVDRIQRSVVEVLRSGKAPWNSGFVCLGMAGVVKGLSRQPSARVLLPSFIDALCDGVAAGAQHARLSREIAASRAQPPTAEEYLDVAVLHINYRSFALALVLLIGEMRSAEAVAPLDAALASASRAVRLANDARTFGKDLVEKSLNVLALETSAGDPVTTGYVADQIRQETHRHGELLSQLSTMDLDRTVQALNRSLRTALGLYSITDLQ